jgi:putative transposase
MVGPAAQREAVAHLQAAMDLSERRAFSIRSQDDPLPVNSAARHRTPDAVARSRQRAEALRLPAPVHLAASGRRAVGDQPHLPALYREEGLTVRKRRARRRAVGTRAPIQVEAAANARWSLDFVHDQLACGRRFRIPNIVDDVTRERLAAIPDTSISGRRVARELTALIERRGKPGMIVSDNGTEFTSNAMSRYHSHRQKNHGGHPVGESSHQHGDYEGGLRFNPQNHVERRSR